MRGRKPKKNTKDKTESPVRNTPKRRYKRSTISSSDPSDDGTHQPRKNILTASDIKAFFKSLKGKKRTQLPIFRNPIQKSTFSDYYSSSEQHSSTEDDDSSYSYYYEEEEEENSDPFSVLTQVAPETESENDENIPVNTTQDEILNIPESNTEISQQINQQLISEGKSDINVNPSETISDLRDQKEDITQQSKQQDISQLSTENQALNQHSSSYEYTYTYSSEEESKIKSENIELVNDTKNQEITIPDESQNQLNTIKSPQTINEYQDSKPLISSPQDLYEEDLNKPELIENSNLKQEDSDQYSYYYTYSSEANEESKISPLQDEEQKQQKTNLTPSDKIENIPKSPENVIVQQIAPLIEENIKEKQEISSKKEILTIDQINLPENQANDSKTTVEENTSSEYSYYYTYSSEAETNATEIKQNIIEPSPADTKPQSVEETKKLQSESEYSYYYTYSEEENQSQTVPKKPVEKKLTQGKLHIDETEDHKYLQVSVTKSSDSSATHKQFTHKMKQQPIKKLSQMKIEKFLSPTKTSKNVESSEYEYYYTYSETDTETKEPTLNLHEIETKPEESDNNKSSIVASLIQSTKSKPKTEFPIPIIKKETITPKQKPQTKRAQSKPQVTDESSSSYYYYYSEEEVILKPSEVKTSKPILEILTENGATKSNTKQIPEKSKQNEIKPVVDSSKKSLSYYSSEEETPTKSIVENVKTEKTKQSSSEYYYSYSEEEHPKTSADTTNSLANINKFDESYYYSSEEEAAIKKENKQETDQPQSESYYYSSAEEQSIKKINDDKVEKLKFSSDQEQPTKAEIKTAVQEEFKQELPQTDSYYSSDDENIKKYLKKDAWANTKVNINAFESDSYYYYSSQEEVQIKKYNIPEPAKHDEVNKDITDPKTEQPEQKPIQTIPQVSNRADDSESYYYSTEEETVIKKDIRYKIPHSESTYSEENSSKMNPDQNINGAVEPNIGQEATTVAEEKRVPQEKSTSKEIIGKVVSPDSKETTHEEQESESYYYSYSSDNESPPKHVIEQHPHENKSVNSESSYYYSSEEDMPLKQQTSNVANQSAKSEIQSTVNTRSNSEIQTASSNTNIGSQNLKQGESESYYYSSEEEKPITSVKQNNQSINETNVPNPAIKTKESDSYYYSSEEEIKPKTTPNNQTSKTITNNKQNDKQLSSSSTKPKEESSSSYYSSEEEAKIRPSSNALIIQTPIVNKQQNSLIATKDDSNYYSSEEEKPSKAPQTPEIKKQVLQTPDNIKQPKIAEQLNSSIQTPVAKSKLSPEQSQKLSQLDKQNKVDPYLSPNKRKLFNKSKLKKFETPKKSSVRYINAYANSDYSSAPPSAFQSPYMKSPAKNQLWSSLRPKADHNETQKAVPNESPKPSPKPKQHENQNEQIHRRNKWTPHTKPNHKPNERRKFNQQNYTNRKPFNFDKYNK